MIRRIKDQAQTATVVRQVGSHQRWLINDHCQVTIPIHTGDLTPGVIASIRRQAAHTASAADGCKT